jgi:hypothetical protein
MRGSRRFLGVDEVFFHWPGEMSMKESNIEDDCGVGSNPTQDCVAGNRVVALGFHRRFCSASSSTHLGAYAIAISMFFMCHEPSCLKNFEMGTTAR